MHFLVDPVWHYQLIIDSYFVGFITSGDDAGPSHLTKKKFFCDKTDTKKAIKSCGECPIPNDHSSRKTFYFFFLPPKYVLVPKSADISFDETMIFRDISFPFSNEKKNLYQKLMIETISFLCIISCTDFVIVINSIIGSSISNKIVSCKLYRCTGRKRKCSLELWYLSINVFYWKQSGK